MVGFFNLKLPSISYSLSKYISYLERDKLQKIFSHRLNGYLQLKNICNFAKLEINFTVLWQTIKKLSFQWAA